MFTDKLRLIVLESPSRLAHVYVSISEEMNADTVGTKWLGIILANRVNVNRGE